MSQRLQAKQNQKRRWITYLWIFGLLVGVSLLIYFERTALLYVLATLGVTALLIIVAVTDLGADDRSSDSTAAAVSPKSSNLTT